MALSLARGSSTASHVISRRQPARRHEITAESKATRNISVTEEQLSLQKQFWGHAATILSISSLSDWYSITRKAIRKLPESAFVDRIFHGSMYSALRAAFPDHQWRPWMFVQTYRGFWSDPANIRAFLEWAAPQLNITQPADWYRVTARDSLVPVGGGGLVAHYKGSMYQIVQKAYPDHEWLPWQFAKTPREFWNSKENQRRFLIWLAQKNGLKPNDLYEWYRIPQVELEKENSFKSLVINKYKGNFLFALQALFPEHDWQPWRFVQAPAGFWAQHSNQRRYFDWIKKEKGYTSNESFYDLSKAEIKQMGGGALVQNYYKGSVATAVAAAYPEHRFLPWKFSKTEKRFWESKDNRRLFLDWAASQLGIASSDAWITVSNPQLLALGGKPLLSAYGGDIRAALQDIYPHHNWDALTTTSASSVNPS